MSRTRLFPYKPYSKSSKELSRRLGVKRIKHEGSRFRPREGDCIINWGASELPYSYEQLRGVYVINNQEIVREVINKKSFLFEKGFMPENIACYLPEATDRKEIAENWIEEERKVVCRTILNASGGRGIVLAENTEQLVEAPLYVKYVPKREEFRVHIIAGDLVHIQRKARIREVPDDQVNWQIRNHNNGFIFQINDLDIPDDVEVCALSVFHHFGLDFGAVDVVWNERNNQAHALEINTAPGLEGTTLNRYEEGIKNLILDIP